MLKSPVVRGIAYSIGGHVSRLKQSALYATTVSSESVYSWFDPVKWPQHRLAFIAQPSF